MKKFVKPLRIEFDHGFMFGTCTCGAELAQSDEYCDNCGCKIRWPKKRHCDSEEPGCEKITSDLLEK